MGQAQLKMARSDAREGMDAGRGKSAGILRQTGKPGRLITSRPTKYYCFRAFLGNALVNGTPTGSTAVIGTQQGYHGVITERGLVDPEVHGLIQGRELWTSSLPSFGAP